MRRAFSLVEMMLASAVLAITVLALFEAVIISTRIAHENSEYLAAEAVAWDAVWKRFNEDYSRLRQGETSSETLTAASAPALMHYDRPPTLTVKVTGDEAFAGLKCISADVEWGDTAHRRRVSDIREVKVARGELGRVSW